MAYYLQSVDKIMKASVMFVEGMVGEGSIEFPTFSPNIRGICDFIQETLSIILLNA